MTWGIKVTLEHMANCKWIKEHIHKKFPIFFNLYSYNYRMVSSCVKKLYLWNQGLFRRLHNCFPLSIYIKIQHSSPNLEDRIIYHKKTRANESFVLLIYSNPIYSLYRNADIFLQTIKINYTSSIYHDRPHFFHLFKVSCNLFTCNSFK